MSGMKLEDDWRAVLRPVQTLRSTVHACGRGGGSGGDAEEE
jgi:hypothetical protein